MLNSASELAQFYVKSGVVFLPPENGRGWGIVNNHLVEDDAPLNRLAKVELQGSPAPKRH